jgi:predicted membrane channel-forming protein YqfA (hemolysin III family)
MIGAIAAAVIAVFFLFWAITWTEWPQVVVAVAFASVALVLMRIRGRRASMLQ